MNRYLLAVREQRLKKGIFLRVDDTILV